MKLPLAGLILVMMLGGCASQHQSENEPADPLEPFNRVMFNFNYEIADRYALRPAAVLWRDYMPQPLRNGLSNFSSNLEEPAMTVNYFLQGQVYRGMVHFTRFFLNSTLGMGGLIDVAGMSSEKLQREKPRRFGTTLGYYGVGYGPYLHLPLYGSFTLRDDGGNLLDHLYPVLSLLSLPLSITRWAVQGIETRAQLLSTDNLLRQSADPYAFTRNAYFQYHDFIASDGNITPRENPNAREIEQDLQDIDAP